METLATAHLRLELSGDTNCLRLVHLPRGDCLLQGPIEGLLAPILDGKDLAVRLTSIVRKSEHALDLLFAHDQLEEMTVRVAVGRSGFDWSSSLTPRNNIQLNGLHCLAPQTGLNVHRAINFRNRHHTEAVWPELLMGGKGFDTTTYSTDWQFAPHPTLLLLEKAGFHLVMGCLELASSFGMELAVRHYRCDRWVLDFGKHPDGLRLKGGQGFTSPRFRLDLYPTANAFDAYDRFGRALVDEGAIPAPGLRARQSWWDEPLYCTWVDQGWAQTEEISADLSEQPANHLHPTRLVMTEKLVREAVAAIRRERLPFRTILLDEGWNVSRGWWEPHPERFPDFRRLVDDIHAEGFKVVVWWNWAEIEAHAEHTIDPSHLIGRGKRNRHGAVMRDYSLGAVQDEYLRPLFRKLFSSEQGCYDLDGIKTDFLADKVHAEMPVADPTWRGEERYFLKIYQLFYGLLKSHKADGIHIGCAGNYWLAPYIDVNRTYDIYGSNWREHENRARMLMATSRGVPVAYDFHPVSEYMDQYFESAKRMGCGVQIGNVLYCRDDLLSQGRRADPAYYELLRRHLGQR